MVIKEYEHKTEPFDHQQRLFLETRDDLCHAAFWEQGTGKSKFIIDTVAWNYELGNISGFGVVAGGGVHRNWPNEEIPIHLPDRIPRVQFIYDSYRSGTKKFDRAFEEFLQDSRNSLAIMAITYDATITKKGFKFFEKFLKSRPCFMALDECKNIKNWKALRTRANMKFGKLVKYKREAEGTPIGNKIWDIYSQLLFLDANYWKQHGLYGFTAFKHFFGIWQRLMNGKTNREFEILVKYQNLARLGEWIKPIASRVLKKDCLDLPPKLYEKRFFKLSPPHRKLYDELVKNLFVEVQGEIISAPLAITMLLRKQQITCGYLPSGKEENQRPLKLDGPNRKLSLLEDIVEDCEGKTIIWSRFIEDCELICELLTKKDLKWVRYDGTVSPDDQEAGKIAFQNTENDIRFFVATQQSAGEGITLHAASTVIYYSNGFSLVQRLQSEDRAHRIGLKHAVTYIDIIAEDTVDMKIVESLRENREVAQIVLGDEAEEWI